MWSKIKPLCKKYIVFTANQPFSSQLVISNITDFKYELVWEKTRNSHPFFAKKRPLPQHESILVFSSAKGWHTYNPQMVASVGHTVNLGSSGRTNGYKGSKKWKGESEVRNHKYPHSVIRISNPSKEAGLHPTQKPVELLEYLIKTYTNEGDTVLDFTMGSGTTGVACRNLGRKFIGVELDKDYFEIAKERILGGVDE